MKWLPCPRPHTSYACEKAIPPFDLIQGRLVVQGYNMDYNEQYRDLAHLCMISAKGIEMHKDK